MWMQISSGRGPEECCLAVGRFVQYLKNECKKRNIDVCVLEEVRSQYKGSYQSIMLSLESQEASSFAKKYEGTLLWICKSPFRANCERRNWFFNCQVYSEPEKGVLDLNLIKVETMRSTGNGGQNVNKLETAVRVTYLPGNIGVVAREERSQLQNRKLAMARLHRVLEEKAQVEGNHNRRRLWMQHNRLVRGNPVLIFDGDTFKLKTINERTDK